MMRATMRDLPGLALTSALDLELPARGRAIGAVLCWLPLAISLLGAVIGGDVYRGADRTRFLILTDQSSTWVRMPRFVVAGVTAVVCIVFIAGITVLTVVNSAGIWVAAVTLIWFVASSALTHRRLAATDFADIEVLGRRPSEPYWVITRLTSRSRHDDDALFAIDVLQRIVPPDCIVFLIPMDAGQSARARVVGMQRSAAHRLEILWVRTPAATFLPRGAPIREVHDQ